MELLLVGAGYQGTPYIAAARRLGVRVRLVESESQADRLRDSVDEVYVVTGTAEEAWTRAAYPAVTDHAPDGILAFNEPQVIAAALLQDRLGLPGPSLHAAVISRNKALQRACFDAYGIPQPEYLLTDDLVAATDWAAARFPVVVKALTGAGSLGVELVRDAAAYATVAARRSGEGRLLVETAVSGPEFSWEALLHQGEIVFANLTRKETTGPPNFVETGHRGGHVFVDVRLAARVDRFVRDVVGALGVVTGIVHLEFRSGPTGPVLIEIAVRTPGDYLMDVLSLTYDVDLYEAVVRLSLGLPTGLPSPCPPAAFAAVHMVTGRPGRLAAIEGLDAVRTHPMVVRAQMRREPGDALPPLRSSDDRVGYVLMRAPSAAELDAAVAFVRDQLRVVTEEPTADQARYVDVG
jgi:biotin carboxylase